MSEKISVEIDGERIIGIFEKITNDQNTCVVTCHGLLANKDSIKYLMLSDVLASHGISSFRFDFRGCGESDGKLENSHITNRGKDLKAVIEFIEDQGINNIGLFGSSMGGFVSILHAIKNSNINALIILSSPFSMSELFFANSINNEYYEIDGFGFGKDFLADVKAHGNLTSEQLKKVSCPTLIYHGDFDSLVPVSHATKIYDRLNTVKELKIIRGGDHIFSNPYHLADIIYTSVDWFENNLHDGKGLK